MNEFYDEVMKHWKVKTRTKSSTNSPLEPSLLRAKSEVIDMVDDDDGEVIISDDESDESEMTDLTDYFISADMDEDDQPSEPSPALPADPYMVEDAEAEVDPYMELILEDSGVVGCGIDPYMEVPDPIPEPVLEDSGVGAGIDPYMESVLMAAGESIAEVVPSHPPKTTFVPTNVFELDEQIRLLKYLGCITSIHF